MCSDDKHYVIKQHNQDPQKDLQIYPGLAYTNLLKRFRIALHDSADRSLIAAAGFVKYNYIFSGSKILYTLEIL